MSRPALVFFAVLMICGSAMAAPGPDRSNLSYDENVLINTACASVRARGDGPYYECINKQVAALQAHPSPDRSRLTPAQNRSIEDRCKYLRRSGVAAYNDCVTAAMARPSTAATESAENGLSPN